MEKIFYTEASKKDIINSKQIDKKILVEEGISKEGNYLIFYNLKEYINLIREQRNQLLKESDIYMLEDWVEELKKQNKYEEMKQYRKDLRDLPENIKGKIFIWPIFPEGIK